MPCDSRIIEIEFARSSGFWIPVLKFWCSERNGVNFVRFRWVRPLQLLARELRDAENPVGSDYPSGNVKLDLAGQGWIYVTNKAKDRQSHSGHGLGKYVTRQEVCASVFFGERANPCIA
jgi:hypothetical protein